MTTKQATSKKWKLVQLAGVLLTILGVVLVVSMIVMSAGGDTVNEGETTMLGMMGLAGMGSFVLGLVLWTSGRFLAWWNHG